MRIIKLFLNGIAWGCTMCVFILIIGSLLAGDSFLALTSAAFIRQAVGSMIVGVGFVVPSAIYEKESLGRPFQTLFHMGIGFLIYFLVALRLNWIPLEYGAGMILLSILIAVLTAFVIWMVYYLYNRHEAQRINRELNRKNH